MAEINAKNARAWSIMGIGPAIWGIAFDEMIKNDMDFGKLKVITADLARYSGLQRIKTRYQNIVYNVGIAEQNMVGIAAGFALEGVSVYMTTYAPFMVYRCADQIRHFMGNMKLPLKAVGSAAGFTAGFSGNALLALSDIAFMRSIPDAIVLSPADCTEAVKLMLATANMDQPVYMRFCGTTGIPPVYKEDYELEIGIPILLQRGDTVAVLASGTNLVYETLKAAKKIEEKIGMRISVYDVHTIKPMDADAYQCIFSKHDLIVSIEEHSVIGGLGSAVMEEMTALQQRKKQVVIGAKDRLYRLGSRNYMMQQAGLLSGEIEKRILMEMNCYEKAGREEYCNNRV